MSYTIRKGKNSESVQIRVSKRGTKDYFSKTVRIPDGLGKREKQRFCEDEERKFENECKGGCKNPNISFREFVETDYFVCHERKDDYKSMLDRTYPVLGQLRMNEITRSTINNFVNHLLKDSNTKSGKPVSVKTVRNTMSLVRSVFRYAIAMGMNIEDPCRDIQYPKSRKKPPKFYGSEELDMLLEAMDKYPPESKYKLFVYIMITTGLRKGEILGLEWKNIDLDKGELSIVQSAKYSRKRGMYLGVPKTDTSVRKVRVPKEVVEMLRQYKAEQDEYILNMGSAWEYNDLLFTQYDGKLMSIQTPYEWLKGFCEKHNLPFKGIHASRHSFASEMIADKMDIVKVSRTLGHSMPSTTLNIYSHLLRDPSDEACSVAEDILSRRKRK